MPGRRTGRARSRGGPPRPRSTADRSPRQVLPGDVLVHPGFRGQSQHALGDDVAQHLGRAAFDRVALRTQVAVPGLAAGQPGAEGSAVKYAFALLNQEISGFGLELLGEEGLRYDDWTLRRPDLVDFTGRDAGYRYLRAKGNSIEGGTSEVLRNIIAERVLGLPTEMRVGKDVPWKDIPR